MRKFRKVCSFIIIVTFLCQNVVFGTPGRNSILRLPVGETGKRLDEAIGLLQEQDRTGADSKQALVPNETAQSREEVIDKATTFCLSLIVKLREMNYEDSPRDGFIIEKEKFDPLLKDIAELLVSFYERGDYESYDYLIKSVIELLVNEGFSDEAIAEIVGNGKIWPMESFGIIDAATSLIREGLAQDDGPGAMSLIKQIVKKRGKILEIGAGKGEFIRGLIDSGILPEEHEDLMRAIDIDEEAIAEAKKKGVTVVRKDATTLTTSFGVFDMVLIGYPETLDMKLFFDIFMTAVGVLKPGGFLLVLTQDKKAIDNHFYDIERVIRYSMRPLKEDTPHTEWKFKNSYEYIVFKSLPILFSGENVKNIIEGMRMKQEQVPAIEPINGIRKIQTGA